MLASFRSFALSAVFNVKLTSRIHLLHATLPTEPYITQCVSIQYLYMVTPELHYVRRSYWRNEIDSGAGLAVTIAMHSNEKIQMQNMCNKNF